MQSAPVVARKRIRCPLDPSHTVFEDLLHKHLKKCNAGKREMPSCYCPGVNRGPSQGALPSTPLPPLTAYPVQRLEDVMRKVAAALEG